MKKTGFGKASGKIILIGEHAVVYNQPAIALPFTKTSIQTQISPANVRLLESKYFTGMLEDAPKELENLKQVTTKFLKLADHENAGFSIKIDSQIPDERGMGSSAAAAISLIRALADYFDFPLSQEELSQLADFSEKIAHGNPSGIDVATVSNTQPVWFIKDEKIEYFPLRLSNTYLLVADTGQKGQTRQIVEEVAQLIKENPQAMEDIEELGRLSQEAKTALMNDEKEALGNIFNQAQNHLKALGVSNSRIDFFVQMALEHGALGAKLTGSGRGGCIIALADSKENALKIAQTFHQEGIQDLWIQDLNAG